MCELHPQKCVRCKHVWTAHKKLASCESPDPAARCPDSLCMYVGNPRKPVKSECDACRDAREAREEEEEEEEESGGKGRGVSEDGKARMKEKGKEIGKNRKENAKGRRGKNDGDVQQGSASEDA